MKHLLSLIFILGTVLLNGQIELPQIPLEPLELPCDCDVLITPSRVPTSWPDISSLAPGDLDNFYTKNQDGSCYRSVLVFNKSNQDLLTPNFQSLVIREWYKKICLKGHFIVTNSTQLGGSQYFNGQTIRLIDDSTITYKGNGMQPVFSIHTKNITIDGGGQGRIISESPMRNGVIQIETREDDDNFIFNHIKNISLESTAGHSAGAKGNIGIVLHNTKESVADRSDRKGTNYHTNITNLDVVGFNTGVRLRGWSNANNLSNLRFEDIGSYGIWLSGSADNSVCNVTYKNSPNASAFRVDNYIDDKYMDLGLDDPDQKITFNPYDIISFMFIDLLQQNQDLSQMNFNQAFEDLPTVWRLALTDLCNLRNIVKDDELVSLGILEFDLDNSGIYNNFEDRFDISHIFNTNNNLSLVDGIQYVDKQPPFESRTLSPTCEAELFGEFYLIPGFNVFSKINIFDGAEIQVRTGVEVFDEENDEDKCDENKGHPNPGLDCQSCLDVFGVANHFIFCPPEQGVLNIPSIFSNQTIAANPPGSPEGTITRCPCDPEDECEIKISSH